MMDLGKPRSGYDDFKDQPIECRLVGGGTIEGIVVDLWMRTDGDPSVFRIDASGVLVDVPYRNVVTMRSFPALSQGWIGPDRLNEAPVGAAIWSDGKGHSWWRFETA